MQIWCFSKIETVTKVTAIVINFIKNQDYDT